jgi:hypothetical protein
MSMSFPMHYLLIIISSDAIQSELQTLVVNKPQMKVCASYQAVLFIQHQSQKCHLLSSDSLCALQSLIGHAPEHLIITEILSPVSHLHKAVKFVVFCWVPGSEATDSTAKAAGLHRLVASEPDLGIDVHTSPIMLFHSCGKTDGLAPRAANLVW